MVRQGVIPELITTTSYGSNRQVCTGEYKRCAPINRRVTIELQ
jgi:outer membrane protein OmpA-like peptidoglycan-associated protein